jgi:hypothetical protein
MPIVLGSHKDPKPATFPNSLENQVLFPSRGSLGPTDYVIPTLTNLTHFNTDDGGNMFLRNLTNTFYLHTVPAPPQLHQHHTLAEDLPPHKLPSSAEEEEEAGTNYRNPARGPTT